LTFPHPGLYWIYGNKDDDDDGDHPKYQNMNIVRVHLCVHESMAEVKVCTNR
jgi:hypothetical protein